MFCFQQSIFPHAVNSCPDTNLLNLSDDPYMNSRFFDHVRSPDHLISGSGCPSITSPRRIDASSGNETGSFTEPTTSIALMEPITAALLLLAGSRLTWTSRSLGS